MAAGRSSSSASGRRRALPPVSRRHLIGAAAAWALGGAAASSGAVGALRLPGAETTTSAAGLRSAVPASGGAPAASPTASPSPSPADPATTPTTASAPSFDAAAHSTSAADSPWVVVNKSHPIDPGDYAPAQLVTVAGEVVSAAAAPDLEALLQHGRDDGVPLALVSGFRTREYQETVHRRSVARNGQAGADRYSARAGFSEHQTGLAVDLTSADGRATLSPSFAQTDEGLWLAASAGQHGWLLRYTGADQAVTGYNPEPWHFRWVGVDLVAAMTARGTATLEEFFGVTGGADYPA